MQQHMHRCDCGWCEGRKEGWFKREVGGLFCTHIRGGGPLGHLQILHLYFTCLFQPVYLPSYTCTDVMSGNEYLV